MYTTSDNPVPNGTMPDPYGTLVRSARRKARMDVATNKAAAAYNALLCRNPRDFVDFGLNVAKDVSDVNSATGCKFQPLASIASSSAAAGDATAAQALAMLGLSPGPTAQTGGASSTAGTGGNGRNRGNWRAAPARSAASCDANSSGGVQVVPLNQPGSAGPYAPSAAPANLTTNPMVGMGRYSRRGLRGCCSDFPWGDSYPATAVASSIASDVSNWIAANPWLTAGIAVGFLFLLSQSGKGRRG